MLTKKNYPSTDPIKEMTWDQLRDYICFDLKTGEVLVVELAEMEADDDE